jgi:hypothetical protein
MTLADPYSSCSPYENRILANRQRNKKIYIRRAGSLFESQSNGMYGKPDQKVWISGDGSKKYGKQNEGKLIRGYLAQKRRQEYILLN